jgi:hypothetical protein
MLVPETDAAAKRHFDRLKARNGRRDQAHHVIREVRQGNIRQLFPSDLAFNLSFQGVPVANFIDGAARDIAECLAPLPALACVSGKMESAADQRRATVKNRIGDSYLVHCRLEKQMLTGSDRYISYGFLPFFVEPDVKAKMPFIHAEDPRHAYYELDRFGNCKVYAYVWKRSLDDLCAQFPEYAAFINPAPEGGKPKPSGDTEIELVRWADDTNVTMFLPARQGLVLAKYAHKMSSCPAYIAERPGDGDEPRGQFDDVVYVQVARAIMGILALEAAYTAVQAPIAVPDDMDEFPIGPHAVMQSSNANQIHKVNLELPPTIFAESQVLDQELKQGSRYPDARSGNVQASVITGKGVEALLGTFDTQIKGAQMVLREAFQQIIAKAFEMDEAWWPNESKTISGTIAASSWELTYTPKVDINSRYNCTVTYGFASGMRNPAQAGVFMLQLQGAGLISKATVQENLPIQLDHVQEQKKVDVEASREALKQGLFALVQSSGQMAASGQDPTPIIKLSLDFIHGIQNGQTVEDSLSAAYATQKSDAEAAAAAQAAQQGPPDAESGPGEPGAPGGGGDGLPPGVAPGQAGMAPGGRPTMAQMISGLRGDGSTPVMQAEVRRNVATGT